MKPFYQNVCAAIIAFSIVGILCMSAAIIGSVCGKASARATIEKIEAAEPRDPASIQTAPDNELSRAVNRLNKPLSPGQIFAEFTFLDEHSDHFSAEELAAFYNTRAGRAHDRALALKAWENRTKYMEHPDHPGVIVLRAAAEKTPEFIKALYEGRTPPPPRSQTEH